MEKNYMLLEVRNDLTREMDKHLTHNCPVTTYILDDPIEVDGIKHYPVRFPGATRGSIQIKDHKLVSYILDPKLCNGLYDDGVFHCLDKFIGKEIYKK